MSARTRIPADIAWKLVAVNLSDLAAKGAEPLGVLLSHMLGAGDARFVEGLREVLGAFDVPLLGGDTVRAAGRRVWSCTAIGRATHLPVPDRRGARPGDGDLRHRDARRAMLGLERRGSGSAEDIAYRRPQPLLAEGRALAPVVSAMMDVSDGLLLDCWRMAQASMCAFAIESARCPWPTRSGATRACAGATIISCCSPPATPASCPCPPRGSAWSPTGHAARCGSMAGSSPPRTASATGTDTCAGAKDRRGLLRYSALSRQFRPLYPPA